MTQYYPIRIVRLVTGETLVAGISLMGNSNYVLERPMVIVTVATSIDGGPLHQMEIAFKNWIDFTSDDYVTVKRSLVACIARPLKEIVADYAQAKISADIARAENEMGKTSPDKFDADVTTMDNVLDESNENDEFPGWGGDPRLSS